MERADVRAPPACGLYSLAEWFEALMDAKREEAEASDEEELLGMFRDTDDDEDAPATLADASESDDDGLSLASDHGDELVPSPPRRGVPPAKDWDDPVEPPRKRLRRGDPCPCAPDELDLDAPASYRRLLQDFQMSIWEARQMVRQGRADEFFRNDRYDYNVRGDFCSYVLRRLEGATRNRLDAYIDVRGATALRTGICKMRSRVDIAGFFGTMPSAVAANASGGPGRWPSEPLVKREVQQAHLGTGCE